MTKDYNINFGVVLHLAEIYQKQYRERNLLLSPEQNEACFRDFVAQYYRAKREGREITPVINTDVPIFQEWNKWVN